MSTKCLKCTLIKVYTHVIKCIMMLYLTGDRDTNGPVYDTIGGLKEDSEYANSATQESRS